MSCKFVCICPRIYTVSYTHLGVYKRQGIDSAIPADEVIWSMKRIGDIMSPTLKETAEGGLAATPTGRKLHDQVFGPGEVLGLSLIHI